MADMKFVFCSARTGGKTLALAQATADDDGQTTYVPLGIEAALARLRRVSQEVEIARYRTQAAAGRIRAELRDTEGDPADHVEIPPVEAAR